MDRSIEITNDRTSQENCPCRLIGQKHLSNKIVEVSYILLNLHKPDQPNLIRSIVTVYFNLLPCLCLAGSPGCALLGLFGRVDLSLEGVDGVQGDGHRGAGTDQAH